MTSRISSVAMVVSVSVSNEMGKLSGRVLDVGCGAMPWKRLVYNHGVYREPFTEYVGLDIRPVGDIEGDMCAMPIEDESFDSVLSVQSLQYALDPLKAMSEMVRVLKPGGRLLVVCANVEAEDQTTVCTPKIAGLITWSQMFGLEVDEIRTASKLFEHEFANYANTDPGRVWPGDTKGFVEYLDTVYPAVNVLLAHKP